MTRKVPFAWVMQVHSEFEFYMQLYVPDFPWRVGLSYLSCRRFYECAQAQAH